MADNKKFEKIYRLDKNFLRKYLLILVIAFVGSFLDWFYGDGAVFYPFFFGICFSLLIFIKADGFIYISDQGIKKGNSNIFYSKMTHDYSWQDIRYINTVSRVVPVMGNIESLLWYSVFLKDGRKLRISPAIKNYKELIYEILTRSPALPTTKHFDEIDKWKHDKDAELVDSTKSPYYRYSMNRFILDISVIIVSFLSLYYLAYVVASSIFLKLIAACLLFGLFLVLSDILLRYFSIKYWYSSHAVFMNGILRGKSQHIVICWKDIVSITNNGRGYFINQAKWGDIYISKTIKRHRELIKIAVANKPSKALLIGDFENFK